MIFDSGETVAPDPAQSPPRIPTYLSHSYRPADRAVNQFFHDVCWDRGFAFTVDSQNSPMSPTRLEMMMRRSACFIAIVTRRDDQPRYRCSPFMVYENGLAIRARNPRLVLLERYVSGVHFSDQRHTVVFDRQRLRASLAEVDTKLAELAAESRAYVNIGNHTLGDVGLLLPKAPQHEKTARTIKRVLYDAGYTPVDLPLTDVDSATAATIFDRLDFVIIDISVSGVPAWLVPFIQGRFIPSIKLAFRSPGHSLPIQIPRLLLDRALETTSTASEVAIVWSSRQELASRLQWLVNELSVPRHEFASRAEGEAYFIGLGRSRGPVFVSSASADNELVRGLVERLRSYNIRSFHYIYQNTIPPGEYWKSILPEKIAESSIFLPLVSQAYWASEYCRQEFETALALRERGMIKMIPCFIEPSDGPEIEVQGISLTGLDSDQRIARIVSHLDRELLTGNTPTLMDFPVGMEERP